MGRWLITGSAGHLGEALVRTLRAAGQVVRGIDVRASPFTDAVGSISDPAFVARVMDDVEAVLHAATLHKPHIATHARRAFVDVNVTGTLNLLEAAREAAVRAFVFTSTTSVFGHALQPPPGAPARWISEAVVPEPKNIYGITKLAAEHLCTLFHERFGLPCVILRTSRFFPEEVDERALRRAFDPVNVQVNEYLHRRVDLADVVDAHRLAVERAPTLGFGRYVISAPTPFEPDDAPALAVDAASLVRRRIPCDDVYGPRGWRLFPTLDRVYDSRRAQAELDWRPRFDFAAVLDRLRAGEPPLSPLAQTVGRKGYHETIFEDGPYPVEEGEPGA